MRDTSREFNFFLFAFDGIKGKNKGIVDGGICKAIMSLTFANACRLAKLDSILHITAK